MEDNFSPPSQTKKQLISKLKSAGIYSLLIKKALKQACTSHAGQIRDDGCSTLEQHIFSVAGSTLDRNSYHQELEKLIVTALLHDTLEDDPTIDLNTFIQTFGIEIFRNIILLSKKTALNKRKIHLSQEEKYAINANHLSQIAHSNDIVKIVKLEDRINNLASTYCNSNRKYERYYIETKNLYLPVAQAVSKKYVRALKQQLSRLSKVPALIAA